MNLGTKITAIVFAVLLLGCCSGTVMMLQPVSKTVDSTEAEAKRYGDNYSFEILKDWSGKRLSSLATPKYASAFAVGDFEKTLLANKKALGAYESGVGKAQLRKAQVENGKARTLSVAYVNRAKFKNGPASVKMTLVRSSGKWSIDDFSIEPE